MEQIVTWGALIASVSALLAVAKFWIEVGKSQQQAIAANATAQALQAQLSLMQNLLGEFKVQVAQTYATNNNLNATQAQLSTQLKDATVGILSRLDAMTTRLDNVITLASRTLAPQQPQ